MATQGCLLSAVAILVSLLGRLQAQQMVPCDSQPQGSDSDPPLPPLPDQFQVHVEANIVQKQLTRNVVEYYDYTNNRAVRESHDHNTAEIIRTVMDFRTEEAHIIYQNGTCSYVSTNSSNRQFGFMRADNGSHVKTVKELLYFGEEMGENFIGVDTVRGIPVNHWQACVNIPMANGTFILDYYFTKGEGYSIDGEKIRVPVRAVINGSAHSVDVANKSPEKHDFYHIYEFTDFHAGPIEDESVFEIPIGTFCKSDVFKKPAPKIPQQFYAGLEGSIQRGSENPQFVNEQLYYDGPSKVMRIDIAGPSPSTRMDALQYGKRPLSIIHDETNGMRYIIDKWEGNCSVVPYRPTQRMITPEDVIAMFDGTFLYQGKKTLRGLPVESWSKFNTSSNIITEVLFQQQTPPDGAQMVPKRQKRLVPAPGRGANSPYVPVGIYVRSVMKNIRMPEAQYNLYSFTLGHPDPDVFDISQCYEFGHKYALMSMKIQGSYERDVLYNKREFITALKSAIARGAAVSLMRVTSVQVEADTAGSNHLRTFFKILDNSLSGVSGSRLTSLAAAKLNLASSISSGLNFDVQYPTIEQNFEVVSDTLWEIKSSYTDSETAGIQQYSKGAMAGLGIGMLVIGCLLGLIVAYMIYKRIDTSVPYEITN